MKESSTINSYIYKNNLLCQIKGFYYTAKFQSISKAAEKLNLTQSTITLQVQSLERDLGLKLFNRNSKPISLTKDGEEFYKIACPLFHQFESILDQFIYSKKETKLNKIEIAMHHITISFLMPKVVAIFNKLYPKIKIIIRNISRIEAIKRLKDGEIDLAFYPNCENDLSIEQIEICAYKPILIVNNKNPLAKKKIDNLADLKKFNLIKIDSGLITLPLFSEAIKSLNIQSSIEFENGNWEMLKYFVKECDFSAVISSICIDKNDCDLVIKNLSKFFPNMQYSIMHKKSYRLSEAEKKLIELIKEKAR